jgi:hypothetical protein
VDVSIVKHRQQAPYCVMPQSYHHLHVLPGCFFGSGLRHRLIYIGVKCSVRSSRSAYVHCDHYRCAPTVAKMVEERAIQEKNRSMWVQEMALLFLFCQSSQIHPQNAACCFPSFPIFKPVATRHALGRRTMFQNASMKSFVRKYGGLWSL